MTEIQDYKIAVFEHDLNTLCKILLKLEIPIIEIYDHFSNFSRDTVWRVCRYKSTYNVHLEILEKLNRHIFMVLP